MGVINSTAKFFKDIAAGVETIGAGRERFGSLTTGQLLANYSKQNQLVEEAIQEAPIMGRLSHYTGGFLSPLLLAGQKSKKITGQEAYDFVKNTYKGPKDKFDDTLYSYFGRMGFNREQLYDVAEDGTRTLKSNFGNVETNMGFMSNFKMAHMNHETGEYSVGKVATTVAGTYMTASSAYRILSGGGLYRDKDGNTDIIGIPGI